MCVRCNCKEYVMAGGGKQEKPHGVRIVNRKARHDYHVLELIECGMRLVGTEVKSLRAGQGRIDEGYVRVKGGEAFLVGANIAAYPQAAPLMQHEPTRDRKLLLHRKQILEMESHARQKGNTIVPLAVYFKRGLAKCEVGLAVGKRQFDKRQDIKKRQQQRDIDREMRRRHR